ncbi:hypothetical protein JCM3766R1_002577 [Sporobolomyces carnicolor]
MLARTCIQSSTRSYSVASKSRSPKPRIAFESSTPPLRHQSIPDSATTRAIPTARSTPSSVPNPGSSTLAASRQHPTTREPPLVEAARQKSVKQRNVFESYLVLNWKTRLYFWLVIGGVAVAGLYGGDYLVPETDEEKAAKEASSTA